MEIKIGVQHTNRELVFEPTATAADVKKEVAAAIADGSTLELTDEKGRLLVVPGAQIGYVEIGTEEQHRVGFGPV